MFDNIFRTYGQVPEGNLTHVGSRNNKKRLTFITLLKLNMEPWNDHI